MEQPTEVTKYSYKQTLNNIYNDIEPDHEISNIKSLNNLMVTLKQKIQTQLEQIYDVLDNQMEQDLYYDQLNKDDIENIQKSIAEWIFL